MWKEFFKFDLGYQLKQPRLWVFAVIMALMAFGATTSDSVQIGGAIGNVIDRQVHGHVVDFIQWYVGSYTWPSFNIADSAIVVGAIGIALFGLFDGKSAKKADNANPKP